MRADLNTIVIARNGRMNMLAAIFGKSPPTPQRARPPTGGGGKPVIMTPKLFDVMFGQPKGKA